jgi:hypothetical protein
MVSVFFPITSHAENIPGNPTYEMKEEENKKGQMSIHDTYLNIRDFGI